MRKAVANIEKLLMFGVLALVVGGCSSSKTDDLDSSLNNPSIPFPAPSKATAVSVDATTSKVTWADNSDGEEGFVVMRQMVGEAASKKIGLLPANTTEFVDKKCGMGQYTYGVYAYYQQRNTPMVEVQFNQPHYVVKPTVADAVVTSNFARIAASVKLIADGDEAAEVGVCWGLTADPTIENSYMAYPGKQAAGATINIRIPNVVLEYGKQYHIRSYAKNTAGIAYGTSVLASLTSVDIPTPIALSWNELNSLNADMPSEIKVYETTTMLSGRPFKAWYAVADLSTGKVGIKTNYTPVRKATTEQFTDIGASCRVLVNGGYFNTTNNDSYSLLVDNGELKSNNISALTRGGYSYAVTRSAFGVDHAGKPSMKWVYSFSGSQVWAYDAPLLNVEGEPSLPSPTKFYPSGGGEWNVASAVGGAPLLVKEGKLTFDFEKNSTGKYLSNFELLQTDIFDKGRLQPRTAVGYTATGKVILMVVDGRQAGVAEGATIDELALLMQGVGCTNVLHLDGGGSSTFVAGTTATLINRPEGGTYQRPVSTTIGFVLK